MPKSTPIRIVFVLFILLLVQGMVFAVSRPTMRVKIMAQSREELIAVRNLKLEVDSRQGEWLLLNVDSEGLKQLQNAGFDPIVVVADLESERRMLIERSSRDYHTYATIRSELLSLESSHPTLAKVYITGQSVQDRDMLSIKISDNVLVDENEPELRWDGNIHGDEKSGMEVAMYYINELVNLYGTDPQITAIVDSREIWFTPCVNPDGMEAMDRYNANGVDCNRDYGYMWTGEGSSPGPFSQPETQAILQVILQNQFCTAISHHGGTEMLLYPWSYAYDVTRDDDQFVELTQEYTALSSYEGGQASHILYYATGTSKDADYGIGGALGFTLELSYDKTPPFSEIAGYCTRNRAAALDLMERAGYGITGVVTDSQTGEPIPALVEVVEIGVPTYCDPVIGDYHRYILPGVYNLRVWANDYESVTVPSVVVPEDGTVTVDVQLDRDINSYIYRVMYCKDTQTDDNNHTSTGDIFGPPDAEFYSVGVAGYIAVDMGETTPIDDLPGNDFTVWEGDGTPEGYQVHAANNWQGPWTAVGTGNGTTEFDLEPTGLESARYIKITDDGDGSASALLPGFDLDAITTVHVVPGCGVLRLDSDKYACSGNIGMELIDADLNLNPSIPDTVTVFASSTVEPTGEYITLTESGPSTSEFTGSLALDTDGTTVGVLGVIDSDTVTLVYEDANCEGSPVQVIETASIDCIGPQISNVLVESVSDAWAVIRWTTDEPSDTTVAYGTEIPPEQDSSDELHVLIHRMELDELEGCTEYYFSVQSVDEVGNTSVDDNAGAYYSMTTLQRIELLSETMDTNPGWTYSGQWAWGQPAGLEGDPSSGYSGTNVVGYNLNGAYDDSMAATYVTTGAIDCSGASQAYLSYWKWLGVESSSYDHATVEISSNGGTVWNTIWSHSGGTVEPSSWSLDEYDITEWASGQPDVRLRWSMGPTDSSLNFCGWNIDDVQISYTIPCNVPVLVYEDHAIDDSAGNDDGEINSGETIAMSVTVRNSGLDATSVSAVLSSTNPHVQITQANSGYPDIPQGGIAESLIDFVFTVSESASDGEIIPLTIGWSSAENSGAFTFNDMVVAPEIQYASSTIMDSTPGDSDGILDPGETAQISINLVNDGTGTAHEVTAILESNQPSYITISDNSAEFGDIGPGEFAGSISPHFTVTASPDTPEHLMVGFTLDMTAQGYSGQSSFTLEVTSSTFAIRYQWTMDANPGWTTEGQWAWGQPAGTGGDPAAGYTGSNVCGYNLNGAYANSIPEYSLTSGPIDCSGLSSTEISFKRWLGVESSSYDHAYFKISTNGSTWTTLWSNPASTMTETAWTEQTYDISAYADGQASVFLRWVMGTTDSSLTYCGWNLDDVEIWAESGGVQPSATPSPTRTPTQATPPATQTMTPSSTPSPTVPPATSTPTTIPPTVTNTAVSSPTPTPTMTPTPTLPPPTITPTQAPPSITPSATPTSQPSPTHTAAPPTATAIPAAGMELFMPDKEMTAGDDFLVYFNIYNPDAMEYSCDAYVLLGVAGSYWSWPGWADLSKGELTHESYEVSANSVVTEEVLKFDWPDVSGSANGLQFIGAVFEAGGWNLIGDVQLIEWGYGI